jgi:protein-disulfide isomerase
MNRSLDRRNVLLALAGLPAAGLLLSGGAAHAAAPATAPQPEGSVDVGKLMQPGALPDMQLGKDDAPVTIVEYASMTCPHSAHIDIVTPPELKKN